MNRALWKQAIDQAEPLTRYGKVRDIVGLVVEALGPADVALGELCYIGDPGSDPVRAEVVGFRGPKVLLMPLRPDRRDTAWNQRISGQNISLCAGGTQPARSRLGWLGQPH